MNTTNTHHIAAKDVTPLRMDKDDVKDYQSLAKMGICLDAHFIGDVSSKMPAYGMDADLLSPLTSASVGTPIQHLQSWLPGFVEVITAARNIDTLVGLTTQGRWEDEEIVQGIMELTGSAMPYGDYTDIPLSSWNVNFETRRVVRFEEGLMIGSLEEARSAAMNVSSADSKRKAAAVALEIIRNRVGFFGYNDGLGRTYGFLNDPGLPAYVSVPTGVGGDTEWDTKTLLELQRDVKTFVNALRVQSGGTIDPNKHPTILALPTTAVDALSTSSEFGVSFSDWIEKTYKGNMTVESAPELDGANGGESVAYLYAETSDSGSTDDNRTFMQVVPAKVRTVGVKTDVKSYSELFANATAGVMVKRPYLVYRASGV